MVTGKVNLTCNAWQAENTDGYFSVTGHWIEEPTLTQWELKSGLLSFMQVNNAHNGEQLGQALFKIIEWVHKVGYWCHDIVCDLALTDGLQTGHITCDNTSNNSIMMQEVAVHGL